MSTPAPVIAIDGPSGSGKGTIARRVAESLGWHLLDSGALYRIVALAAAEAGVSVAEEAELAAIATGLDVEFATAGNGEEEIMLAGREVSGLLRNEECGRLASSIASVPAVREALLGLQKSFREAPGLVADGRDMGSVVFPDAALKVFLTASAKQRAKRRHK